MTRCLRVAAREIDLAGPTLSQRRHVHWGETVSPINTLEVNAERLWATIERSAEIGRFRDTGLRRLALSREDKEVRDLFVGWAREAGCTVEIDPVGNIFARRAGHRRQPAAGRHRQPPRHADLRRSLRRRARCHVRPGGDPDAQRPRHPNASADRADHVDQRGGSPLQPAADGVAGVRRQAAGRAGARHEGRRRPALRRRARADRLCRHGAARQPSARLLPGAAHRAGAAPRPRGLRYRHRRRRLQDARPARRHPGRNQPFRRHADGRAAQRPGRCRLPDRSRQRHWPRLCGGAGAHDDAAHRMLPQPARHHPRAGPADRRLPPPRSGRFRAHARRDQGGGRRGGSEGAGHHRGRPRVGAGAPRCSRRNASRCSRTRRRTSACPIARC